MSLFNRLKNWFDTQTFTRLDANSSIGRNGRDSYEYREGDHVLFVQVELQSGQPNVVFYASIIEHWQPPYDNPSCYLKPFLR